MMEVLFSDHAEFELSNRHIERAIVELVVTSPDAVRRGRLGRKIFQKLLFDPILDKSMLFRVIVDETEFPPLVVTVYKTSRIDKYL